MSNILHSSNTNEWYTPRHIVGFCELIARVKRFELDPASCQKAQEVVQAERFYTKDEDGLSMSWAADSVFCNPPYGRQVGDWVDKMRESYRSRDVAQGFILVNATPDRGWFQDALQSCGRVFFFKQRIKFLDSKTMEPRKSPTHGNALFIWSSVDNERILLAAKELGIKGSLLEVVQ